MIKKLFYLPLDLIEWIVLNLYFLSGGRFEWLNSLVVWIDLISDETIEMIIDLEGDDDEEE